MASSGYVADTFVAGEQPTTAKWNELWGNDASFNTGNGFNDGIIIARHLAAGAVTGAAISNYNTKRVNNGTDIIESSALLQSGWVCGQPGASSALSINVVFPTAFSSIPIVLATFGGDTSGVTSALGAGSATINNAWAEAINITTTGFTIRVACNGAWATNNTAYAQWLAIGD